MNPLILTFSFLLLLGLTTSSELRRFQNCCVGKQFYDASIYSLKKNEFIQEVGCLDDFRHMPVPGPKEKTKPEENPQEGEILERVDIQPPKRQVRLKINEARPPNNSRLNLSLVLHDSKIGEKYCQIAARLIRMLYAEDAAFNSIPEAEIRLLSALQEKREQTLFYQFPDDLYGLELEDEGIQKLFHYLLKGGEQTQKIPPLLEYLTFDSPSKLTPNQKKINFFFASDSLIRAAMGHEVENTLLDFRNRFRQQVFEKDATVASLNRSQIKKFIKESVEKICMDKGIQASSCHALFDYSLGKQGNIIIYRDPLTGLVSREKFKTKN